ncbi:MAG TPA: GMC family oxidoreductase [Thermoanaerobaculia bacterium]|jgi:cholesterol oxidase
MGFDYDVVVIGSGFGGSVAALRLTEKGYRVAVLEAGRRFAGDDIPKTSWDLKNFLWAPALRLFGVQRIAWLKDVVVLSGAGVGGGSLVYANTLYEPPQAFYDDGQWRGITDWKRELAPHYEQARRMLGVVENPLDTAADRALREVAEQMGAGHTYRRTPVGVYFGQPGVEVDDPYFGGVGPKRTGCTFCGNCMVGCRVGAKNRLDVNYLHLAERGGAEIHPMTTVDAIRPLDTGYAVETRHTARRRQRRTYTAEQVVLAAGALGTQRLLHEMRDTGVLPRLSPRLGVLTRTNSESILGVRAKSRRVDYSHGMAITSSFHPDERTHIEPVRYGKGSNAMGLLSTLMTEGGKGGPRWWKWLKTAVAHPGQFVRSLSVRHWSERTVILLVMQTLDNSLTLFGRKRFGRYKLTSKQGHGEPNPSWIPAGTEAAKRLATVIDGDPGGTWGELVDVPLTAHIIGGCVIGATPNDGVIDAYHRVFGYEGLHIVDGAAVSANLGVNPALTITAQAERAFALWPNRGERDPRPPLGAPYQPVPRVAPHNPIVPAHAPAALQT